jgi:riboflavin kinase / FMN adenylyltransferase
MNTVNYKKNKMIMTAAKEKGSAIAIGNFDGFHLGHQKIIDTLKRIAQKRDLISMIMTFVPNPKLYFKREPYLISTDDQKKKLLETQGVDKVVIVDFPSIVNMTDVEFLKDYLIQNYHVKHMVMGRNFHFGKQRTGDINLLKDLSDSLDFQYTVVQPVMLDEMRISSSLIREQLGEGQIEISNRMLGRLYYIDGIVTKGEQVGRQIGFPTINIKTDNTLLPEGVFKTRVQLGKESFRAITNVGYRPTFKGEEKRVESHMFDFDREIYGASVRIYFEKRVRSEMKFDSKESLVKQIKKDINQLKVDKGTIF